EHHARHLAVVFQHHPAAALLADLGDAATEALRLAGMLLEGRHGLGNGYCLHVRQRLAEVGGFAGVEESGGGQQQNGKNQAHGELLSKGRCVGYIAVAMSTPAASARRSRTPLPTL